jgi:hypothetical protein
VADEFQQPPPASGPSPAPAARANRQVAKLRTALREREARVHELEVRLAAVENSTATQFGRVVAAAARRPRRGVVRLPRQLYRLWKRRDSPQPQPSDERRGHIDIAGFDRPEDRMLVAAPAGPPDGLTVAGVFGPAGLAAAEDTAARVVSLLPHDAALAIDTADADLVIVDAEAAAPGGAWAYLGEPGMYDREQSLAAVLETARGRGLPVVLWGDTPPPGLARLDWAATDSPGVSLRRFNPVGVTTRDATPVVVEPLGAKSRVPLGVRRLAGEIAAAIGARAVPGGGPEGPEGGRTAADPASLPGLLRRSAVTLALTPSQVPEQLAAGALVLCPAPVADRLPADLRDHVRVVNGGAAPDIDADGYDPRPALRTLFLQYATPVRLARLCENLGLAADPLGDRRVAVLAAARDEAAARRLAAATLAQVHRPAEAVITGPAAAVAAAELAAAGLTVHTTADQVRSAWIAPWPQDGEIPDSYLLDLVCAAECSGADVVGPGAADPYTFTTDVEPALLRRDLHASGGTAADLAVRGARLLCLDPRR